MDNSCSTHWTDDRCMNREQTTWEFDVGEVASEKVFVTRVRAVLVWCRAGPWAGFCDFMNRVQQFTVRRPLASREGLSCTN